MRWSSLNNIMRGVNGVSYRLVQHLKRYNIIFMLKKLVNYCYTTCNVRIL